MSNKFNEFLVETLDKSDSQFVITIKADSRATAKETFTIVWQRASKSSLNKDRMQINGMDLTPSNTSFSGRREWVFPFNLAGTVHRWKVVTKPKGALSVKLAHIEIWVDDRLIHGDVVS